ncbi:hypothetical protein [Flavobacterium degerlachei]|jgi:hypothetical protein|uniref:Uncharacterized protein n=1 Tax=Flavobacterium degerlachei TaxID=229203 RepID=A0A1H3GT55_9FLAO|nr:hypothetical protein [Flavobacterium degerlachei]SDY06287.1 hypothetical protein SAMN05444338_12710 [Flavobacterium degerlachei]
MAKKSFSGGLNSLLGDTKPSEPSEPTAEPKEPKAAKKEITKSSQIGTKAKETRATFIVNEDLLEKLKALAYWDRVLIKDIINQALEEHISRYEKKNGEIKEMPKK